MCYHTCTGQKGELKVSLGQSGLHETLFEKYFHASIYLQIAYILQILLIYRNIPKYLCKFESIY